MKFNLSSTVIVYLVSEDWYFLSHRLPIARAARDAGARVVVATRCSDCRELIEKEGFRVVHINFNRVGLNPFHELLVLFEIIRCYRDFRPDIVHHVGAKPILLGQVAATFLGVRCVINAMAGMGFLYISRSLGTRFLRKLFEAIVLRLGRISCSRFIVQNEDDADVFSSLGVPDKNIVLIPGSGVDCDRFFPVSEPEGEIIALCVCRLLRDKGVYELVDAARILKAREVPVRIRLVGGRDDNPTSVDQRDIIDWGREGLVDLAGHSDSIDLEYRNSHIAVLPSYREGLPKSLLEAAASGRPIVSTDVPGCRSICLDGDTGILVPVHDPQAIADAIQKLVLDGELRKKMGAAGRNVVLNSFSQEVVVEKTLSLYAEMVLCRL